MTAQTTTQRTAAHRRRMAEKMARYEGALQLAHDTLHECTAVLTASDCAKVSQVMQRCREALQGSETTQKPLDPTQRG